MNVRCRRCTRQSSDAESRRNSVSAWIEHHFPGASRATRSCRRIGKSLLRAGHDGRKYAAADLSSNLTFGIDCCVGVEIETAVVEMSYLIR